MTRLAIHAVNHIGLGHLSRTLTIANWLTQHDPSLEILFVLEDRSVLFDNQPFPWLKIPGPHDLEEPRWGKFSQEQRDGFVRSMTGGILDEFQPDLFIYDTILREPVWQAVHRRRIKQLYIARLGFFVKNLFVTQPKWLARMGAIVFPNEPADFADASWLLQMAPAKMVVAGPMLRRTPAEVDPALMRAKYGLREDSFKIVVNAGGGGWHYSQDFFRLVLNSLARLEPALAERLQVVVVTGPYYRGLALASDWPDLQVVEFEPNLIDLMAASNLLLCQCGYNVMNEAVELGIPTLCLPSPAADDQMGRATRFAARFANIHEAEPERLNTQIAEIMAQPVFQFVRPATLSPRLQTARATLIQTVTNLLAGEPPLKDNPALQVAAV